MKKFCLRNAWVLVPVMAAVAWVLIFEYRATVPSRSEWSSAVDYVRTHRNLEDGFTWHPYWAEEGTSMFHGLNAFETPNLAGADFADFGRVWMLTSHGHSIATLPRHLTSELVAEHGPVKVWRILNRGERVVADLYADLDRVKVVAGARQPCDFWAQNGWHCLAREKRAESLACLKESTQSRLRRHRLRRDPHCGLSPWFHVSRDVRVIQRHPRQCVWLHPKKAAPFRLTWTPNLGGDVLVFRYGFTDRVIMMHDRPKPRTQPAQIRLEAFGKVHDVIAQPKVGWFEKRVNLPPTKTSQSVTITATTQTAVDAHLCVELSIREGPDR